MKMFIFIFEKDFHFISTDHLVPIPFAYIHIEVSFQYLNNISEYLIFNVNSRATQILIIFDKTLNKKG